MSENGRELVEKIFREACDSQRDNPPPPRERPRGVHYTQLGELEPGSPLYREWNTYRREVGRLLAEGCEGESVLIRGTEIVGIYPTWDEAREVGLARFLL